VNFIKNMDVILLLLSCKIQIETPANAQICKFLGSIVIKSL
jgi:hypothetical protein